MADLFNRQYTGDRVKSFSADGAKITFAGDGGDIIGTGLLTTQIGVSYMQQISKIYELGSFTTFLVAGRTSGNASLNRVLGPRPITTAFYRKYGDVCQAASNLLSFSLATQCGQTGESGSTGTFTLKGCVITTLGFAVNANDLIVNENLAITFVSLDQG